MPLMCGASELSSTLCTSTSINSEGLPMFTTFLLFTVFTGLLDIHHSATTARTCPSQNKSSGATTTSQTNSGRMFQTTVLKRSILLFFHSFFSSKIKCFCMWFSEGYGSTDVDGYSREENQSRGGVTTFMA